jgi:heme iron utilization protein
MSLALEAKQFLRCTRSGVLSSFSAKFAGYPFGSVMPFVLGHDCQPIVLISTIAEHTKNIIANPKVSLLVFQTDNLKSAEDLHVNGRLTLIGEAEQLAKNDANLMVRYCRYFPESTGYLAMHDFQFYRINITQARYIAGFGKMGWISGKELAGEEIVDVNQSVNIIAQLETSMIEHMNADHTESMMQYCQHFHGVTPSRVILIGVDCDGFDIEAVIDDAIKILRFTFESPIVDANSARMAFVALSKSARA